MTSLAEAFGLSETPFPKDPLFPPVEPQEIGWKSPAVKRAEKLVDQLEKQLFEALEAAQMCPGCWYEHAQGGALADHDRFCSDESNHPVED